MADYPKKYTKGDQTRLAYSKAQEVSLNFDGFVPAEAAPTPGQPEVPGEPESIPAPRLNPGKGKGGQGVDRSVADAAATSF